FSVNNYGPWQYPEKLIPLMIANAVRSRPLPVYGDGEQIRDWLYVDDHAAALQQLLLHGGVGESYNVGGYDSCSNIDLVHQLCDCLQVLRPPGAGISHYRELITHVPDRPGHDRRYALDASKIYRELGWRP